MGKYMRKAKRRGKKSMNVPAMKPSGGGEKPRVSDGCYLELRSRKLKKTMIQRSPKRKPACAGLEEKAMEVDQQSNCSGDSDEVAQNFMEEPENLPKNSSAAKSSKLWAKISAPTASQIELQISVDGASISRSSSSSSLAQASLCVITPDQPTCRKTQTQDQRNHPLICKEILPDERMQEIKALLGQNSTQTDQERLSLRKSSKILRSRQCSQAGTPCTLVTATLASAAGSEETPGDGRLLTAVLCKNLFSAPSAEEIDDFFAGTEWQEPKLFTERYNFDFQNDLPLHGRYEWISLVHS